MTELPEDIRQALNISKDTTIIIGNEYAITIWNAAVEAAAELVQDEMGEPDDTFWIVQNIRKLKK